MPASVLPSPPGSSVSAPSKPAAVWAMVAPPMPTASIPMPRSSSQRLTPSRLQASAPITVACSNNPGCSSWRNAARPSPPALASLRGSKPFTQPLSWALSWALAQGLRSTSQPPIIAATPMPIGTARGTCQRSSSGRLINSSNSTAAPSVSRSTTSAINVGGIGTPHSCLSRSERTASPDLPGVAVNA